ncbi:hypothetical protein GCM10009551_060910 [Nocardiopsis tropica]
MAIAITRTWSTLKLSDTEPFDSFACRPRKFDGTRPVRKAHQEPELEGALPSPVTVVCSPGCSTRPKMMPITTAMNAVIANHTSVLAASRAALVTLRRLAIDATTAVTTRGTTATVSSLT